MIYETKFWALLANNIYVYIYYNEIFLCFCVDVSTQLAAVLSAYDVHIYLKVHLSVCVLTLNSFYT